MSFPINIPAVAICYCGSIKHHLVLTVAKVPIETFLCHCASCRYWSGALCTNYLIIKDKPNDLGGFVMYSTSVESTRYFCSRCGAHVYAWHKPSDTWGVAPGVLQQLKEEIVVTRHKWLDDTGDGGLAAWLSGMEGISVERFHTNVGGDVLTDQCWETLVTPSEAPEPIQQQLEAKCHCGGVKFHITRPHDAATDLTSFSPPDFLGHETTSSSSSSSVAQGNWWLRQFNTRYLAGFCACTSCCSANGFEIQPWAYIPKSNIVISGGASLTTAFGALRTVSRGQGVQRGFCTTCGASVFKAVEDQRIIAISVGLLRATNSRAEDWLEWETGRIGFQEMATNANLTNSLRSGLPRK
ncbi:Mss4-like protein [Trichoderma sp. SZMC 28013]